MSDQFQLPTAEQISDDVSFTEASLDDDMVRQPALVAHYGILVSELQFNMDMKKQVLEVTSSKVAREMRDEAAENGNKITEASINSKLPTDPRVMKAQKALSRAKADYEAGKVTLEALRHKKDMMIQIGVNRRSELENKIRGLGQSEKQDRKDAETRAAAKQVLSKAA